MSHFYLLSLNSPRLQTGAGGEIDHILVRIDWHCISKKCPGECFAQNWWCGNINSNLTTPLSVLLSPLGATWSRKDKSETPENIQLPNPVLPGCLPLISLPSLGLSFSISSMGTTENSTSLILTRIKWDIRRQGALYYIEKDMGLKGVDSHVGFNPSSHLLVATSFSFPAPSWWRLFLHQCSQSPYASLKELGRC